MAASLGLGMFFRTRQLRKKVLRIYELENEMISNHAEILRLQQEIGKVKNQSASLNENKSSKNDSIPVVPLKKDGTTGS